jgi:adenylate kinase family enzyme
MPTNARPLFTFELVEHFLVNALDFPLNRRNYSIVPKIVNTELNIENFDDKQITLKGKAYRNLYHRKDPERILLKKKIVADLLTKKRLDNDERISLGKGGALPQKTNFKQEGNAYIITGLPASGKSGVANKLAEKTGSIILDSDYAKRKLPEFNCLPFGATLVHEESDEIVFGNSQVSEYKSVFETASKYNINIVIPKIGHNFNSLESLINTLKREKYKVHLTLVELDRKKATRRALERFIKTNRYVPLGVIFDSYSNNPTVTFYRIIMEKNGDLDSYSILSTDVGINEVPIVKLNNGANPISLIYQ